MSRVPYARNLEGYPIVFASKDGPMFVCGAEPHVPVAESVARSEVYTTYTDGEVLEDL